VPDQIIFDLDPGPGITWALVVNCALDIKEHLEERGLKSFVKLSGGKGLHIHLPLSEDHTWEQVSSFAKNVAMALAEQNPLYISQSTKSRRSKKIYIDYLRNHRGSSAVLPYSLRAKTTSAVAMPVAWTDLGKIKTAGHFTLEKALKHLKGNYKDPWKGYWRQAQVLPAEEPKNKRRRV
jgi:bifunctional non-homologous end joining protein LigD